MDNITVLQLSLFLQKMYKRLDNSVYIYVYIYMYIYNDIVYNYIYLSLNNWFKYIIYIYL